MYKVKINVSGFTKTQIEDGLPHLLDEFGHRPWLLDPQAFFDETSENLVIIVGHEHDIRIEEGAFDEISDCLLACMTFDKKIHLDIQKI